MSELEQRISKASRGSNPWEEARGSIARYFDRVVDDRGHCAFVLLELPLVLVWSLRLKYAQILRQLRGVDRLAVERR